MNEPQKQDLQKLFTENLNTYMMMHHKQQKDLIEDLGYSRSAVSSWCNGTRMPKIPTVDEIASYFKINRSDLIGDANASGLVTNTYLRPMDLTKIMNDIILALENGSQDDLTELQKQYQEEKARVIKDTLRTIEHLSEENIDELYHTICIMQSRNNKGTKKKLTAVFRPQNPNQPKKVRNTNENWLQDIEERQT